MSSRNSNPVAVLVDLMQSYGEKLLDDPFFLKIALGNMCSDSVPYWQRNVLVEIAESGMAYNLWETWSDLAEITPQKIAKYRMELEEEVGFKSEVAAWGINSWLEAFRTRVQLIS